ncbi:hypothetical protein HDU83_005486 [Entophlyctis luteolus]|nr:hypothetical protein HDU83_005486 [Entophlyctis luteolus]
MPLELNPPSAIKPLFQRCIDLIATLYSFPLFEYYLFPEGIDSYLVPSLDDSALPTLADPVELLWHTFKLGAPLCVIYNELAATTTGTFLQPDDVSTVTPSYYPTIPCKDNLFKFVTACANDLQIPLAKEMRGISDLYKDNTSGFMKFLRLVEDIVHRIDLAKNLPAPKPLPFSTEVAKEIANPLDNRSRLIKEIVETERAYIFALEELHRYEVELINTKVFVREMAEILFSNLDDLLDFQRRFMVGMESTVNLGVVEQRIGQLFILNNATKFAVTEAEELKRLGHIIQPHQIQSFLIKPLQRLIKYPMLLKELLKLTDPATYPYMEELKEGYDAIKRVTEKLNEVQRRDENERMKQDITDKMEDWKGLQIKDFGDLLLMDRFLIASSDQEKEYSLFLFEKMLLCCKKDLKQSSSRRSSNRKKSDAGQINSSAYTYVLRGNIYMNSILRVLPESDPNIGLFSIRVFWKDSNDSEEVCFTLKCRNEELQSLWTDRLQKQLDNFRQRKNSNPYSSLGWSEYQASSAYDMGYSPSIISSGSGSYGPNSSFMSRSLSSGSGMYAGQLMSPHSPGVQYNYAMRQGSFDQQYQPYYDGGLAMQAPMQRVQRGPVPYAYGPTPPMPMMPSDVAMMQGRMVRTNSGSTSGYVIGPDGRPMQMNRTDSQSSASVVRRPSATMAAGSGKSRDGLNALASLASSGLPIAGFSDDDDDDDGFDDESEFQRPSLDVVRGMMQGASISSSTSSKRTLVPALNGINGGNSGSRRTSNDRNGSYPQQIIGRQTDLRVSPVNLRNSPQPGTLIQQGYERVVGSDTLVNPRYQFPAPASAVGSPSSNGVHPTAAAGPAAAGPPIVYGSKQNGLRSPLENNGLRSPLENVQQQQLMKQRAPTGSATLTTVGQQQHQTASFIRIRAHYDGDVLIIAMPMRGATLQELRNRVERKANMMPHKAELSNPIQLVWKEEVTGGAEGGSGGPGGTEWRVVGVLQSDEDVVRAFASSGGLLNLFLS